VPGFTPQRAHDGFVILHRTTATAGRRFTGPAEDRAAETLLVLAGAAAVAGAATWAWRRDRRRATGPDRAGLPEPEASVSGTV
jgi:hypothetical protein